LVEEEENEEDPSTIRELRLQLANVKTLVEQNEQSNSEYLAQYKEFVKLLCGYDIRFGEDGFCEAENILSKDCTFLFQKQQIPLDVECTSSTQITTGAGIDLLDSESARQWKDVLENYLVWKFYFFISKNGINCPQFLGFIVGVTKGLLAPL